MLPAYTSPLRFTDELRQSSGPSDDAEHRAAPVSRRSLCPPTGDVGRCRVEIAATEPAGTAMNQISRLLPPSNVLLDLQASSKKRVFEQIGLLFENNQGIARATVFDSLFARERLGSTGLGQGVAIPHGRIKGLKEAVAAFVRLSEPIAFDAPDGRPVNMLVFLLVPEQATQQHLDILSELAQMLSDKMFRENLQHASDPSVTHTLLAQWEPMRPAA
jgi:nitrogen PTS system EIIA component